MRNFVRYISEERLSFIEGSAWSATAILIAHYGWVGAIGGVIINLTASILSGGLLQSKLARIGEKMPDFDAAAMADYANDLDGMTAQDIEDELRNASDQLEEIEPWIEALTARQRQMETEGRAAFADAIKP